MQNTPNNIFKQVIDNLDAGIILLDSDLLVISSNEWISEHSGMPTRDITGKNIAEVFNLEPDSRIVGACRDAIEFGLPTKLSNRFNASPLPLYVLSKIGDEQHKLQQKISIKKLSSNEKKFCQLFVEDVSSMVVKEGTLKQLAEENQHARQIAEAANTLKSEFLATMSHEIRTPMTGVLGMLNLLHESELNTQQQHFTKLALSSANSLLSVINDILDFSKIEAGKMEVEFLEFDLVSLMSDFTQTMAIRAREKDLELILDLAGIYHSNIISDPGRIRQILTNIVGNALKFTESGEIVVKASLQPGQDGMALLEILVRDTGIGIAKDKLESLFESFTQADASTSRRYGGTGLGLAIAKQLSQLLGGDIVIKSEVGVGSEFTLTVRVKLGQEHSIELPSISMKNQRILIVDDNTTSRLALSGLLKLWGAHVSEADSGAAALNILEANHSQPFDIAILDMQMPGMDGIDLSHRIWAQTRLTDLPLVMLTSMGARGDARFFAELGFAAYLPKPVTPSDLRDALSIIIDGGEALNSAQPLVTRHHILDLKNHQHEKYKILVAEDKYVNQELLRAILEPEYHIDVACNGKEVLEALRQAPDEEPYCLVLMDCFMPEMDGYEATRAIRAGLNDITCTGIPIIALTANTMQGDREICIEAGMDDYLGKPIDNEQLAEKLKFWLGKHSRNQPANAPSKP